MMRTVRLTATHLIATSVCFAAIGLALCGASPAQTATTAPAAVSAPAASAADVPKEAIQKLEALFARPQKQMSDEEAERMLIERMQAVVKDGERIEKEYPHASNIQRVRNPMLRAVNLLSQIAPDPAVQAELLTISRRIVDSTVPQEEKIQADFFLTLDRIKPAGAQAAPGATKDVRDFVARYEKTRAAPAATYYGALLAKEIPDQKLMDELMQTMDAKYPDDRMVRVSLRRLGWFIGRPFAAELTRMDGTTLSLPKDLAGKIVVIDFWATWCPPCVGAMPEVKAAQDKLKAQGVEFVSISLDEQRQLLETFVKDNKMDWTQTFTGKGWEDPTAVKYGVNSIPSMWLIGKNGKVISDDVRVGAPAGADDTRQDLNELIKKAQTQPAR